MPCTRHQANILSAAWHNLVVVRCTRTGTTLWVNYFSWFMRWIRHQSCANRSTDPQPMTQITHPHAGTYTSRYVVNVQQQLNVEQTNEWMNHRRMRENMSNWVLLQFHSSSVPILVWTKLAEFVYPKHGSHQWSSIAFHSRSWRSTSAVKSPNYPHCA